MKYKNGYLQVCLCKDGKRKTHLIHRLVAQAFLGECPYGYHVDHLDFNKENNSVDNLRYLQASVNAGRWSDKGRKRTIDSAITRLSKPVLQYTIGGELVKTWNNSRDIERELGFFHQNISSCCNGTYKSAYGYIWKYAS